MATQRDHSLPSFEKVLKLSPKARPTSTDIADQRYADHTLPAAAMQSILAPFSVAVMMTVYPHKHGVAALYRAS
jgi:hypothetical protein